MEVSKPAWLIPALISLSLAGCAGRYRDLPAVREVSLEQYSGTWYEIARLPNRYETGLECVTADYTVHPNGNLEVVNRGHVSGDTTARDVRLNRGTVWVPDLSEPGRLKVRSFLTRSTDYWIVALDSHYRWSLVGHPSRSLLWVMSRKKTLPDSTLHQLFQAAQEQGFDTTLIERVRQGCD